MRILKPASKELKEMYDGVYEELQLIRHKKYISVDVQAQSRAAVMMDTYGAPILGGQPMLHFFEGAAVAAVHNAELVSNGFALKQYKKICKKCGGSVLSLEDFP